MNSNQTSPPTAWCEGCKTNWASHWRTATNHQPPGHPTKASDCSVQRRVSSVTVAVKLHAFRPKLLSWFPKLSCRVENDMEIEHIAQHSTNLDLYRSTKWFIGSYIIGIPWCSIRSLWKVMERISYCFHGYLPIGRASILATSKTPPRSPLNFCTWRLRATIPQQLKICKVSTCRTILAVEDYKKEKQSIWLCKISLASIPKSSDVCWRASFTPEEAGSGLETWDGLRRSTFPHCGFVHQSFADQTHECT